MLLDRTSIGEYFFLIHLARPKPLALELSNTEWDRLEKLIKRHNVGQQIALREQIV
jgi:hypothetical protein